MFQLVADSTCDLGKDLTDRYKIEIVPLYVYAQGKTFQDGVNVTLKELYRSVEESGQLPKTSAPTVLDFQRAFALPGEILYIGLSSALSATFQNAVLAQNLLDDPHCAALVDSRNLSTGIGLLLLRAADLRDQGVPLARAKRQIGALLPKVRTSFVVETLDYLYKGGRCSAVQNIMGSLLHIRPVIAVREDGTLGVKAKTRGSREKALRSLIEDFQAHLAEMDLSRVFITHSGCDADAAWVKAELLKLAPIQDVFITYAGCVVASHCGPGTLGILYLLK